MKINKITYLLITLSVCICAISISCASNKSFEHSKEKIENKLLAFHSEDYPARITNVMWRQPDIELTVTIEIEPDAQSGKAFEDVLEQTRWAAIKACNAINFPHHAVPPINILVRDDGQLVHVERGGFAHFVVIALNLPTDVPSFVNFSADWCDKGHKTDAAMDEVAKSLNGKVHFETVDTDKEADTAAGTAINVAVSGNFAYVANGTDGFIIVDISDPTAPFIFSSLQTDGYVDDVAIADNMAYLADGGGGFKVVKLWVE